MLLTLAILGLPTAVYAWGRSSSSFDIVKVKVSGTHLVPAKKTLRLLQAAYVGENLFTVTAKDVQRTLRPASFVHTVKVNRDFPGTLRVAVTEHKPAAYILAGGAWYVLDQSGYVICSAAAAESQLSKASGGRRAAKPDPAASGGAQSTASAADAAGTAGAATTAGAAGDATSADAAGGATSTDGSGDPTARLVAGPDSPTLPLPRIAASGAVQAGDVLSDPAIGRMLTVITALPGSYRRRLATVEDQAGRLTLRFAGGPVVVWGDEARTAAKALALRTVLRAYATAGRDCSAVDVSIPDRTLARPVLD